MRQHRRGAATAARHQLRSLSAPSVGASPSRIGAAAALAVALLATVAGSAHGEMQQAEREPAFVGPAPISTGDFDGNGRDDLAIGVPREDVAGNVDAGAVAVLYADAAGLGWNRNQLWTQGSPGVPGALERTDGFGWATTTGDFDADGYDDLAIGAPLEGYEFKKRTANGCCILVSSEGTGAVNVLYGSRNGLTAARAQLWHQGKSGIKGQPEKGNFMGAALAAGDFNGDGHDELAVGVPGENHGAGAVQILPGSRTGLKAAGDQLWLQTTSGVEDTSERGDAFGAVLAAGNVGYSSREDDLAIGVPGEDIGAVADAGAVAILHGQPGAGLTATLVPDAFLHQNGAGAEDAAEKRDLFGAALAIGDFGRSPEGDLAVGVPGENGQVARQGAVQVFYGSAYGVSVADDQLWREGSAALVGTPTAADELGRSLAAADFNGFSQDDLAIGSPYAAAAGTPGAGTVHVVYGGPAGLTTTGSAAKPSQLWTRATLPNALIPVPVGSDLFGFALGAGRFRGAGDATDLAVSAPNAASTSGAGTTCCPASGLVHVLAGGTAAGLGASNHRVWHQNTPGVLDESETGDRFGGG